MQETVTMRFCQAMRNASRFMTSGNPDYATVSAAARRTLFNVLGTAISAAGSDAVTIVRGVGGQGAGAGEGATAGRGVIPGLAGTASPYWAALATGTAAHLDDFDDTHLATVIHPGASVLATVLASALVTPPVRGGAGHAGVSGDVFLGAFAAGCEAQLRIGNAISPAHYDHGWHITGTCGVFGAAVAESALLGLGADEMSRALSLAAVMTAGHREAFGSMTKPLHAGKAAANGILAARLASAGLSGPADPLGPGGVLDVLAGGAGHVDRSALLGATAGGHDWELELNTFKTYPCGVVAHPAMDAAIEAFPRIPGPAAITGVAVTCNPLVLELMGLVHPDSGLRARFSARHGIAAGLRYGRAGLAEFSDVVATDPEMTRLRDLISLNPDSRCARDSAVLRVTLAAGEPVEVRVAHARGSTARPLTDADLLDKVDHLVTPVLGPAAAARIWDVVNAPPGMSYVTGLLAAIRPAPAAAAAATAAPAGTAAAVSAETPAPASAVPHAVAAAAASTDAILALALAPPALADEMAVADQATGTAKDTLAVFNDAVTVGERARVPQAVEWAARMGVLPGGHALTAFVRAVAALAGSAEIDAAAAVVCAAATALGENCAEAVAVGGAVTDLVAAGLPDAGAQGWSAEVVSAAIGGCVAAGVMLGLSEPDLRAAIGITATQAAGLSSAAGTDARPLQAGKAAFNAVEAAMLAQGGFTSSPQPLEGRRGLYALFAR